MFAAFWDGGEASDAGIMRGWNAAIPAALIAIYAGLHIHKLYSRKRHQQTQTGT